MKKKENPSTNEKVFCKYCKKELENQSSLYHVDCFYEVKAYATSHVATSSFISLFNQYNSELNPTFFTNLS